MKIRDLSAWESFYWGARESSFTRAAKRLNLGLPLLSKRIAGLEETLGVRLFQRSTRKVSLTQDGQGLLPLVQSFLEDAQGLEEHFANKNEVAGTIRMSCVTAYAHRIVAPIVASFSKMHPKIQFDLEITDATLDLIDQQMDLAIRVQEPTGADFVFKKLVPNDLVLCASPSYLKAAEARLRNPEDLVSHPILSLGVYRNCRFKGSELSIQDLLNARAIRCESGLFLTELACQGAGIAVRSIWDVEPLLKSGKLRQVLKSHPLEPFGNMYAVIPHRRLLAYRVRAFIDFLDASIKKTS